MKKDKSFISLFLIMLCFCVNCLNVYANERGIPYINPEWEEYMKLDEKARKEYNIAPEKYIVDYVDTSGNTTPFNTYGTMTATLPAKFNLRDNYATTIYDQETSGLCWAYTTATTVESHLKRTKGITRNISVKQMDYLTAFTGFASNKYGILTNAYATRDFDVFSNTYYIRYLTNGWDSSTSYFPYLASGASAMTESAFGIYNNQPTYTSSVSNTKIVNDNKIEFQVTEYVDFPNYDKSNAMINLIKNHIYNYGAIYIDSIAPDYRSGTCYDSVNDMIVEKETCQNATVTGRHAMAIIGWDDSYGGTGAFILQNSWGEGSYAEFPHLSYQSLIKHAHGIKKMEEKTWDNNYDISVDSRIYFYINGNRVKQGETAKNLTHTSNYKTDVVYTKSSLKQEKLHSINFESDVQNGEFEICISTSGNLSEIKNKVNCKTVTSELPGLITIDYKDENLNLTGSEFIISVNPLNENTYFMPSVNAFTTNVTTVSNSKVYPNEDIEYYEPYDPTFDNGLAVFEFETFTNNILDGNQLTYKVYNSNNSVVYNSTSGISIYTRPIYNNRQKVLIEIDNDGRNDVYRVDVLYNNVVKDSFNITFGAAQGSGTIDDPYIIMYPLHVGFISLEPSKHYKLGKDVDLNYICSNENGRLNYGEYGCDPIDNFTGTLDGNNYTLSGLYVNRPDEDKVGLFSEITDSTVKNLKIKDFDITGKQYVGTLFGKLNSTDESKISLKNIEVSDSKITGYSTVGGLVGTNYHGNLDNINGKNNSVTATWTANGLVGGLIGSNVGGTLSNMTVNNTILKSPYIVGGIIGSSSDGNLNNMIITNSTLEADNLVGGVIAFSINNEKTNLKGDNNTFITTDATVGGIVGNDDTDITNSYLINSTFTGNSESVIGGIVGSTTGEVKNSYSKVTITGGIVGGIVGETEGNVTDSYSISNLNGETVGGIIGKNPKTTVNNRLYHIGDLNGGTVGGIIGNAHSWTEVKDVFKIGNINDKKTDIENVGGIVGYSKVVYINNAYFIGDVPKKNNYTAGGIFGYGPNEGSQRTEINLTNTYYASNALEEITYGKNNVLSISKFTNTGKKTIEELKDISTFNKFDLTNTWEFKNTNVFPTLKSVPYIFVSDVLIDETINLLLGDTKKLEYTVTPVDAYNKDVEIVSNKTNIVTIGEDGILRANNVGTGTITIKSKDRSINKEITVNVLNKNIKIINDYVIEPNTLYNNSEGTIDFNIELIGLTSNDISYKVINKNTNNEVNNVIISKISESTSDLKTNVKLKAIIPAGMNVGEYKLIATSGSLSSNEISFKINDYINVSSITLNKNSLSLFVGGAETLIATILPNNAMNKNVIWSSSNTNVATVNNGTVTAISRGTATITAKTVDGEKIATAVVTVKEADFSINSLVLANSINAEAKLYKDYTGTIITTINSTDIENNTNIVVTIKNSSGTNITNKFVISKNTINNNSSNITISVPNNIDSGSYTIEYKIGNILKTSSFIINDPIYITNIKANDIEIDVGNEISINPLILPSNAFNKGVTYKSNNTNIAKVDSNGLVKGISSGITEIVITAKDSNKYTKTIKVTVKGDKIELSSDSTYVIIEDENNSNIGYIENIRLENKNDNLERLKPNMLISEFSIFNAQIKNSYGELIDSSNYDNVFIGTGSQVIVGTKTYKIVITGDVNGDADINTSDAYSSILHVTDNVLLTEEYLKAAEIDGDGFVTTSDAYNLILFVIGQNKNL